MFESHTFQGQALRLPDLVAEALRAIPDAPGDTLVRVFTHEIVGEGHGRVDHREHAFRLPRARAEAVARLFDGPLGEGQVSVHRDDLRALAPDVLGL